MNWTRADDDFLKTKWSEGRTASEISRLFRGRYSRNAVIGRATRLKLAEAAA